MAPSTIRKAVCLVMLSGVVALALLFGSISTASAANLTPTKVQMHATARWGESCNWGCSSTVGFGGYSYGYSFGYSFSYNSSFYRPCWYGCHYW